MSGKSASTRQELLRAAAAVFSECGYARATTKEIAKAAGIAEGTIYRHFADKKELFRAVFAEQNAASFEGLLALPDLAGTKTVRENLQHLVRMIEEVEESVAPLQAAMWSDAEVARALIAHPGAADAGGSTLGPLRPLTRYLVAEQALGRVRADVDARDAAFALFSIPFASVTTMRVARNAGASEKVDIMAALDVVLRGLEP